MKATLVILSLLSYSIAELISNDEKGPGELLVPGGIDFSGCVNDPDTGYCCIEKKETISSIQKDPILECTHKNVEKCHYTYITQFSPSQEEVCEENFEKICQITFKQQAFNETVKKCYRPLQKVCNGQGPEECRTLYESSCTTKYVEKQPGKFVSDTSCEKLPIEICGAGCVTEEGPQECHDKVITSIIDIPEEFCDLNPQKICKLETKLVPKLTPFHECTTIPQESCQLKFTQAQKVDKPLRTKWCFDESPNVPGETYDESSALGDPITSFSEDNLVVAPPSYTPNENQDVISYPSSFESSENKFSNTGFEKSQTALSPHDFDSQNDFSSNSFASSVQQLGSSQNTFGLNQQQPSFASDGFSSNTIDNFGSTQSGFNSGSFGSSSSGSNREFFESSPSGYNSGSFESSLSGSNSDSLESNQQGSNIGSFESSQSETYFSPDKDFLFADSFDSPQPSQLDGNAFETGVPQSSLTSSTSNKVESVLSPSTFESTQTQSSFSPNIDEFALEQSQSQFPKDSYKPIQSGDLFQSNPLILNEEQSSFPTFGSEQSPSKYGSFGLRDQSDEFGFSTDSLGSSQQPLFSNNNFELSQLQSPFAADTFVSSQQSLGFDSFGLKEQRQSIESNPSSSSFIREESTIPIFQSGQYYNPQSSSFENFGFQSSTPRFESQPNVFDPNLEIYRRF
uniref:Uncharacterized protein n=1 Tax=Lepeophtheirus salmonis TaxID=72036 RepID=A0A0K2SW06_LEPSM